MSFEKVQVEQEIIEEVKFNIEPIDQNSLIIPV
jgi:hypothetical protein